MSVHEQLPAWYDDEHSSHAEYRGMHLMATPDTWSVYRNGDRLCGGYWRQLPGQRPASARTRLAHNKLAAYAAAFRRVPHGD